MSEEMQEQVIEVPKETEVVEQPVPVQPIQPSQPELTPQEKTTALQNAINSELAFIRTTIDRTITIGIQNIINIISQR